MALQLLATVTADGQYTNPSKANLTFVAIGGGAGGGPDFMGIGAGGGGGGGAIAYKTLTGLAGNEVYDVVIGTAGASGSNGGDTSVGVPHSTSCLAKGGSAGIADGVAGAGGLASGCTGDAAADGGDGGTKATTTGGGGGAGGGYSVSGSNLTLSAGGDASTSTGGTASGSGGGAGGNGGTNGNAGNDGSNYGGAGGGAGQASATAGAGKAGVVYVYWEDGISGGKKRCQSVVA